MTTLKERIAALLSLDRKPVIEGWTEMEKAWALAELVLTQKPTLVVEIGVFGGRSLIPQAMAMKEGNTGGIVVGIDPWTKEAVLEGDVGAENAHWWGKIDMDQIANGCHAAIIAEGVADDTILIRAKAHVASLLFEPASIEILSIDGNHSELSSCRDVRSYLPLVISGGFIWFDDTDWSSTNKAVAMMDAACDRVKKTGNCVLFQKR